MKIIKTLDIDKQNIYINYYKSINGGIDGYYERTILDGQLFTVIDEEVTAYFTLHEERGLTSLFVLPEYKEIYDDIFDYVLDSHMFNNLLFSENDSIFHIACKRRGLHVEIQAYNFEMNKSITSKIILEKTNENIVKEFSNDVKEFIDYNHMDLKSIDSFYYKLNGDIISFGALEPLQLNPNRYCLSMIVNDDYRGKGYGYKTVQFLIEYLQQNKKEVNARCYVENTISKKTLLKSGMVISNVLYKVEGIG